MHTTRNDQTVILDALSQWEVWDWHFKARAVASDIWDRINPDLMDQHGNPIKPWLTAPRKPYVQDYPKVEPSSEPVTRSATTTYEANPEHPMTPDESNPEYPMTPDESHPEYPTTLDEADPEYHTSVVEMTPKGRKVYEIAVAKYCQLYTEYQKERDQVRALTNWVGETVKDVYLLTCCPVEQPLHKWYAKLREHFGSSPTDVNATRKAYLQVVKPLTKPPKDWNEWIDQWMTGMLIAQSKGLLEATDAVYWTGDLVDALGRVMPDWILAFTAACGAEIRTNTLTYPIAASILRKQANFYADNGSRGHI
ncbi:hypothetical protein GGR54DRAFT_583803 [Hypoxylon sp. NC1633]|nr:hypothetical protein GGR54DRAFT_583803 [Hypoxylon sp. NC1633]